MTDEAKPTDLLYDKHREFIIGLDKKKDSFEYWVTEHLRLNGMYWGITAMHLLKTLDQINKTETIDFIVACQQENGGFSGNIGHDAHLLYTLSAVQLLLQFDSLDRINVDKLVDYVKALQQEDGSFVGDEWKEVDTRFSYCALCCLALLGKLDVINKDKAASFIESCKNFDGGFGCIPGAESHAGQVFTCVGALTILGRQDIIDRDLLGWWLSERQVPGGGLNGRPEKKPDVCYSWWVLSSLCMIDRLHWISCEKLKTFIFHCQDSETGGIADRPGDEPDVFHCYFGIGGLSLMGYCDLLHIDPVYALPVPTLLKYNISLPWINYRMPSRS
eukprot:TRINITY_DN21084_c0_g1_i1.p1 TRINITY_DN21084_c0_g1~~TRINITY_DN21084_c0_g1_i1.p1  ORF type:complete len:331 (+),score=74.02 TRINITY_DN21084_c0_g1_i1:54-1046(+)